MLMVFRVEKILKLFNFSSWKIPKIPNYENAKNYFFAKWLNVRNCSIWKINEFFKLKYWENFTIWKIDILQFERLLNILGA